MISLLDYPKYLTIYHQEISFISNLEILGYNLIPHPHAIHIFEKNIFHKYIQLRFKYMLFFWIFSLQQLCLNFILFYFYYFWLHWVFVAARGLSLVAGSGGYSFLRCTGFSLRWLLLLRSTGSRHMGFSSFGTRVQ